MIVDFQVWLLKWHFAIYFTVRDWLEENLKIFYLPWKYVFGFIFILHDAYTNIVPLWIKFEKPQAWLVTDRLQRYKKLPVTHEWHQWAAPLCDFIEEYDPGHCDG